MELEEKTVVFVDDEEFILRSLKRLFKREGYRTVFFDSAKDVITFLEDNPVDLVVSDIRMPDMDGYNLLSYIKDRYPLILRVALSGYTESKLIYNLIEKNIAKLFIFKPWDSMELKKTIEHILGFETVLKKQEVLGLINNLDSLPVLPEVYVKVNDLVDTDADIKTISNVIEQDQAIAGKILKLANSAFYGRKTGDLNEAIMGIGLNNIKNIILGNAIFTGPAHIQRMMEETWEHSVRTNKYVHLIYSEFLMKKLPAIFGSVGLLHDIGKVIFISHYNDDYISTIHDNIKADGSIISAEKEKFNVNHQEIGAYLLDWWQLPYAYVEAAMYHHRPSSENVINKELLYVVHLANYYSMSLHVEKGKEDYLDARAFSHLSIDREMLEAKLKEVE